MYISKSNHSAQERRIPMILGYNNFRAPKTLPTLLLTNTVPKKGFPVAEALRSPVIQKTFPPPPKNKRDLYFSTRIPTRANASLMSHLDEVQVDVRALHPACEVKRDGVGHLFIVQSARKKTTPIKDERDYNHVSVALRGQNSQNSTTNKIQSGAGKLFRTPTHSIDKRDGARSSDQAGAKRRFPPL